MRTRVLRRPIVFLRVRCSICVRCSILILLIKTVRCSIPHCALCTGTNISEENTIINFEDRRFLPWKWRLHITSKHSHLYNYMASYHRGNVPFGTCKKYNSTWVLSRRLIINSYAKKLKAHMFKWGLPVYQRWTASNQDLQHKWLSRSGYHSIRPYLSWRRLSR